MSGRFLTNDPEGLSLLQRLSGEEKGTDRWNSRAISFLSINDAQNARSGLVRDTTGGVAGLMHSWGQPCTVFVDSDYDEVIEYVYGEKVGQSTRRCVVISSGPDQIEGTKDDIVIK